MTKIIFLLLFGITATICFPQSMVVQKTDGSNLFIEMSSIAKINFIIPCPGTQTLEYAGKTYNTVQIGNQCWLKENLDVGTMVNSIQSQPNNGTIEKFCYNNDENNCAVYGGYYTWNEAMQHATTEGAQGICPSGWHIPKVADYQALINAVSNGGNAIKAIGEGSGNGLGTNTSGFGALLAGGKNYNNSSFTPPGSWGGYWASKYGTCGYSCAYSMHIEDSDNTLTIEQGAIPSWGFPIRCIKNN